MKRIRTLILASLFSIFCVSCKEKTAPKFIAHRGYNKQVNENGEVSWANVENTCEAFLEAAKKPFYGLETDIYLTKDHRWVCCHDPGFKSNGVDKRIFDYTLEEIKAMPLDDPTGHTTLEGNPYQSVIPTLEEYLSIGKQYNKICLIEFKEDLNNDHTTKDDIKKSIDIVKQYYSLDGVMFICFNINNLIAVKEFEPTAKCQYLISSSDEKATENMIENAIKNKMDGSFSTPTIKKEYVKRFHKAKLEVNCWTIDNKEEADRIASFGVDYITSNCLY